MQCVQQEKQKNLEVEQHYSSFLCLCRKEAFFMGYAIHTYMGFTQAVIDDYGDVNRFYQLTHILQNAMQVRFLDKFEDASTIEWNFKYDGRRVTLEHNIYTGISLFPTRRIKAGSRDNRLIALIADRLDKVFPSAQPQSLSNIA